MKQDRTATRIILGALPAMALLATSATAQDAAPPPAPPVAAPAPPSPVAPPPAAEPAAPPAPVSGGASAEDRAKYEASVTAATGTAGSDAAAAEEAAPAPRATRRPAPRQAPRVSRPVRAAAPVAAPAAPAVSPAATPAPAATPTSEAAPTASPSTPAPEATPADEATPVAEPTPEANADTATTTETKSGIPFWAWIVGALALLGLLFAFLRRGKREEEWVEPVAAEPVYTQPVVAPVVEERATGHAPLAVAAAPIAAAAAPAVEEHAEVVDPAADEVAAITGAAAPVAGRPWIELSLRPVWAGATTESATVELELTLANAGEVAARNVRVSTFMVGDATGAPTQIDRLSATGHGGADVDAGEIGAGEGSRIDATLAVPRDTLTGASFTPVVVADVRYTLPDGGEGRTAAAFTIGADDGEGIPGPLRLDGEHREDIAAALHGMPERI